MRWLCGNISTDLWISILISCVSKSSSGAVLHTLGGIAQLPGQLGWSEGRNLCESSSGSPHGFSGSSSMENGTLRFSLSQRVLAMLVNILKIQVFNELRPSNRLIPCSTP